MAGASVSIGVDATQFKQGMQQAQQSAKSLSAQLKATEAQFRATGDKEQYLADKAKLLKAQLDAQKTAAANAQRAMEAMRNNGIAETSSEYQKLQTQLANATAAMYDTETALNELTGSEQQAAGVTKELTSSLDSINKKVSFDAVINGIDKITGGLEKAAGKVIDIGKGIWDAMMDAAQLSDDYATQAMMLDMNVEDYQRYKKVFDTVGELTVKDWMTAKRKVQAAINKPTDEQVNILSLLGVDTHKMSAGKYGMVEGAAKDWESIFWEVSKSLQAKVASGQLTQDLADTYANALFGKSFMSLKPMMALGEEGFKAALEEQTVASEEAIQKNAELNDTIIKLQGDFETLKIEVMSGLAPALTEAAKAVDGLLERVMEYLESPEGQQALQDLGTAVSGLFDDLGKIDPEQVVEGFTSVFNTIVSGLQWMVTNEETLKGILGAIVTAWGTAKLVNGALDVLQLIQGIKGLTGAGAAAAAGQAGATAGAAWGAGFAKAVIAAAPWLVGVYTLLNPADTDAGEAIQNVDAAGVATTTGMEWLKTVYKNPGLTDEQKGMTANDPAWEIVPFVADVFGQMSDILNDPQAAGAILQFGDDITGLVAALEGLGYEKNMTEDQYSEYLRKRREEANAAEEDLSVFGESAESASEIVAGLSEGMLSLGEESGATSGDLGGLGESAEEAAAALDQAAAAAQSFNPLAFWVGGHHANGLFSVPWDGYPAILHKGERVLTARENQSYTYNTYFGNVNLNNGLEIEALTESIDRRNRRQRSGYGS